MPKGNLHTIQDLTQPAKRDVADLHADSSCLATKSRIPERCFGMMADLFKYTYIYSQNAPSFGCVPELFSDKTARQSELLSNLYKRQPLTVPHRLPPLCLTLR